MKTKFTANTKMYFKQKQKRRQVILLDRYDKNRTVFISFLMFLHFGIEIICFGSNGRLISHWTSKHLVLQLMANHLMTPTPINSS